MRNLHNHQRGPATRSPRGTREFGPGFDGEFGGMGFGPGFGGPDRRRGRRRGGRGGDVRAAVLLLLDDAPRHGYQLIQDIAERSSGVWTPSPGSVYPVLQQLEDEGLITIERIEGRNTATLTADGQTYVEDHREAFDSSWAEATTARPGRMTIETGQSFRSLLMAWREVMQNGTPEQRTEANELLDRTRKSLYGILAGHDQTN